MCGHLMSVCVCMCVCVCVCMCTCACVCVRVCVCVVCTQYVSRSLSKSLSCNFSSFTGGLILTHSWKRMRGVKDLHLPLMLTNLVGYCISQRLEKHASHMKCCSISYSTVLETRSVCVSVCVCLCVCLCDYVSV